MSEVLHIYFVSSNIRTCFFYRNDFNYRSDNIKSAGVKIQHGKNFEFTIYGSVSLEALAEVPDKCLGVSPLFARKLGLLENEKIIISNCEPHSVEALELSPKQEEDHIILLSCKTLIEAHLLNQVRVVSEGQILPLHVFSNIVIDVEIGKLKCQSKFGKLEKFTEVHILQPSEKLNKNVTSVQKEYKYCNGNEEKRTTKFFNNFNKLLRSEDNFSVKSSNSYDKKLTEAFKLHKENNNEYIIWPRFLLPKTIPDGIKNKFIITFNDGNLENSFGPQCTKIFSKVQSIENKKKEKKMVHKSNSDNEDSSDNEGDSSGANLSKTKSNSILNYVINFDKNSNFYCSVPNNIVFCPFHIMKKLHIFVGCKLKIEKVKFDPKANNCSIQPKCLSENNNFFWDTLEVIRENIIQNFINNVKFNCRINTLIVGGSGTGKTFLVKDIVKHFSNEFIFCKILSCKTLRGKKMETLVTLIDETVKECCNYEPSLLVLDDLHALTFVEDEENQFDLLYSNRVVELLTEYLKDYQEKFNLTVVATATSLTHLCSIVSTHGSRLFQDVFTIPEMNFKERYFALNNIIKRKIKIFEKDMGAVENIANNTSGYTIQNLNDLVEKAIFNCVLREESLQDNSSLKEADLKLAFSETIPTALREVKLKENSDHKWEDVGGMERSKTILTEMFSWPLKYPKLLESCPLRLQKGVLLYGAPGTGKTLLAGALANKCGLNFISVKGPEVLSKYVGASEAGVRNLFNKAQKAQPCLLFFDEFESLVPKRGLDSTGVTDRVVNQFLTQLDGVEALNGVWVLAATSRPDLIDPALLRPGRLDKLVFCSIPNKTDRLSILRVLSKNLPKGEDVDLSIIAEMSEDYTGADLQAILYNAQMLAIKEAKNILDKKVTLNVGQKHLLDALKETKPSLSQSEKLKYEKIYQRFKHSKKAGQNNDDATGEIIQKITLA